MQVSLVSTAGSTRLPGSAPEVLLPDLIQVLDPSAAPPTRHEQDMEQRDKKLRRKDADDRAAVAHDAATPRPADIAYRAERDMLPGSQAARQEQLRSQTQDAAAQEQRGFRQALTDATNRGSGERPAVPAQRGAEAATDGKAAPSGNVAPGSGKPAVAVDAGASQGAARPMVGAQAASSPTTGTAGGAQPASQALGTGSSAAAQQASRLTVASLRGGISAVTTVAVAMKGGAGVTSSGTRLGGEPVAAVTTARAGGTGVKAPAGQHAGAASEAESKNDANIERILRLIQTRIGKDRSVATLRLDPPELGTLRLRMDLRNDQLLLQVETQTGAAQRLLSEQLDTLRKNLEASGIHLERVEIRAPTVSNGTAEPNTPQHAGAGPGWQEHSTRQDAGSAGGGSSWEPESLPAEPSEASTGAALMEPAAESLVNVLA